MKITKEWLQEHGACASGIRWFLKQEEIDSIKVLEALIADDELSDANWLIVRVMNRKQKLQYAIKAAKEVLPIFERNCPEDNRPKLAIEAAKKVLVEDTEENRSAANAAAYAAYAAFAAARAASSAAFAAASAASSAAFAAAFAASSADFAAAFAASSAADAADAARQEMLLKILNYGIKLLKEEKING